MFDEHQDLNITSIGEGQQAKERLINNKIEKVTMKKRRGNYKTRRKT